MKILVEDVCFLIFVFTLKNYATLMAATWQWGGKTRADDEIVDSRVLERKKSSEGTENGRIETGIDG